MTTPSPAALDLGVCNAFTATRERCPGRLIVVRESNGFLEAVCDQCGSEAGCPPGARRRQETEQDNQAERPEPYWAQW